MAEIKDNESCYGGIPVQVGPGPIYIEKSMKCKYLSIRPSLGRCVTKF